MSEISQLAYVHPDAKIGEGVIVKAFAYIDRDTEIGDACVIGPHVSIHAGARIGKNNKFFDGCIIAATPQDFRWKGEASRVVIGDNNVVREHVIINRSIHPDGETSIGNNSFVMAQTHVGHDSKIGNWVVIGNSVKIAGACRINDYTILSSAALVHENCEIGRWVLVKGGCRVNNNVPPFCIMAHNPITYFGVNAYLLRKGGYSEDLIDDIAKCYRHIYQSNTSTYNAVRRIAQDVADTPARKEILDFIRDHDMKLAAISFDDGDEA